MTFNFEFRTVEDRKDLLSLINFMRIQSQGYPDYQDWVSRTEVEIEMGWKTGVLALSDRLVVGDVVWQPHKQLPRVREIKNMRVHPAVKERYFARFLMKQAESEVRESHDLLMLDLREDHLEKRQLTRMLRSMGYQEIQTVNLYDPHVRDIVMIKKVSQKHL